MDEEKLIGAIFENLPVEMSENILMFMDIGTVLYLCANSDPLNTTCTENFWKMKVAKTFNLSHNQLSDRSRSEGGWNTWRDMAFELYSRSLEEMCFECSQYGPRGELRQCEECGVDLCRLCRGDSEFPLCLECQEGASGDESAGGAARRGYSANALRGMCYFEHGCEDDAEVEDTPISFNDCYKYKRDEMEHFNIPSTFHPYSWKGPDGRCINI